MVLPETMLTIFYLLVQARVTFYTSAFLVSLIAESRFIVTGLGSDTVLGLTLGRGPGQSYFAPVREK